MNLSTLSIIDVVEGKLIGDTEVLNKKISGVSIDSRKVKEGELYIPIIGERFDGHEFIEDAYKKGATIVLCSDEKKLNGNVGVLVEDTKKALIKLAKYYRDCFDIPVIGITGSVGKTSCKEMVASVLNTKYKVHKTSGNYNNDIGLPLTILDMPEDTDVLVLEMGMNNYGEIDLLSWIARPSVGIITNIGVSHIEFFGSKDGILKAKSEIINHMDTKGVLLLNGDDEYLEKLIGTFEQEYYLFGFEKSNNCFVKEYRELGFEGLEAQVRSQKDTYNININSLGKHMLYHGMIGILIGEHFKLTKEEIEKGVAEYKPAEMRLNIEKTGNNIVIINDTYNASVDSMKSAIDILSNVPVKGKKIAILGDMFEMGEYAKKAHAEVGKYTKDKDIDVLICVGELSINMYEEAKKYTKVSRVLYFENQDELLEEIKKIVNDNDTVLLKASRGMKLEITIEKIREVK